MACRTFAITVLGVVLAAPGFAQDVPGGCLSHCKLDEIVSIDQQGVNGRHTLHTY